MQANESDTNSMQSCIETLSVPELRALCKKHGITGYSKLAKSDLIFTLHKHRATTTLITDKFLTTRHTKPPPEIIKKQPKRRRTVATILESLDDRRPRVRLETTQVGNLRVPYHPPTRFVFEFSDALKTFVVLGRLDDDGTRITALTKPLIDVCSDWGFGFVMPENLSSTTKPDRCSSDTAVATLDPTNSLDALILSALGVAVEVVAQHDDDDDDDDDGDVIPDYDEILA